MAGKGSGVIIAEASTIKTDDYVENLYKKVEQDIKYTKSFTRKFKNDGMISENATLEFNLPGT